MYLMPNKNIKRKVWIKKTLWSGLLWSFAFIELGLAHTANKVWFKRIGPSRYRVYINSTLPELKEFREYHVDFNSQKKAIKFYWEIVKGADFYPTSKKNNRYQTKPSVLDPW